MALMVVTLDVSKISGWLNADAPCRESKRVHAIRGEVLAGGGGRGRVQVERFIGRGPTEGWGPQGTRGAHQEHTVYGRDAGGVEA
eukprot:scaffold73835_cov49-Phaeocystis_antarctica.AAC.2